VLPTYSEINHNLRKCQGPKQERSIEFLLSHEDMKGAGGTFYETIKVIS
jgi:hypothetical protein